MMNSIPKRIVFLTFCLLSLTQGNFALSSSLKIQDFQSYKNTEQKDVTLFYRHIFKEFPIISYSFLSPVEPTASLSEKIAHQTKETFSSRNSLKSVGSCLRLFLRDSISAYVIAQVEAAPPSGITLVSAPLLKNNVTTLAPKLKAGSDYIKPGLTIKNILNTHIQTNVSYHAQEETLETKLSKRLSKTLELELTNTNTFTEDRVKKVLFGLFYQF